MPTGLTGNVYAYLLLVLQPFVSYCILEQTVRKKNCSLICTSTRKVKLI